MGQFGIDRYTFEKSGISRDTIDRIYRCLFVYSTGFHQMLSIIVNKVHVVSIWKTFTVLLEYCCKTDYQSLLNDLERDHKEKQEETNNKYKEDIEKLVIKNKNLNEAIENMKIQMLKLEKEAFNERQSHEKADKDFNNIKDSIEKEVMLRMKFEDKLNSIHSMNRQLKKRVETTQEQYTLNKIELSNQIFKNEVLENELSGLKVYKSEADAKIKSYETKIDNLNRELDVRNAEYNRNSEKLTRLQKEYSALQSIHQEGVIKIDDLKSKVNNKDEFIKVQNDKIESHLKEIALKNKAYEDLQQKHDYMVKDLERAKDDRIVFEKEIIGLNEIKKERNERVQGKKYII